MLFVGGWRELAAAVFFSRSSHPRGNCAFLLKSAHQVGSTTTPGFAYQRPGGLTVPLRHPSGCFRRCSTGSKSRCLTLYCPTKRRVLTCPADRSLIARALTKPSALLSESTSKVFFIQSISPRSDRFFAGSAIMTVLVQSWHCCAQTTLVPFETKRMFLRLLCMCLKGHQRVRR